MSPVSGPIGQQSLYAALFNAQGLNVRLPDTQTQGASQAEGSQEVTTNDVEALQYTQQELEAAGKELVDYIKSHPQLPGVDHEVFEGLAGEELMQLATALMDQASDKVSKVTTQQILANKEKLAKVNEEKVNKIMEGIKKDIEAKPGFWGKLFGWVGKILTAVTSVVAMVVGAALIATGAGAGLGVALFALGAYMAANVTVDAINAVRESKGLPPLSWSPSLGQLAALVAKGLGASEETQQWIKLGVDIVTDVAIGIAMSIMIPGAGLMLAANRMGKVLKAGEAMSKVIKGGTAALNMTDKVGKVAKTAEETEKVFEAMAKFQMQAAKVARVQGSVESGAAIGKAGSDISVALDRNDADQARADVKKLMALITKLQQAADEFATVFKDIEEKRGESMKRCSQSVAEAGEATATIVANTVSMA